jgi:hypothetical protein
VALFGEGEDLFGIRLVPFDAALLDESLVTEMLNVVLHPGTIASIPQSCKVIGWNDTKLS